MKARVESTSEIVTIVPESGEQQARVWRGITEKGIVFELLVVRVAAHKDQDLSQFEQELKERPAPHVSEAFPLRMIL